MGVLGFFDLVGIHVAEAAHVQQAVVGVFVIDGDQAPTRAINRKILDTIMVHAYLYGLFS